MKVLGYAAQSATDALVRFAFERREPRAHSSIGGLLITLDINGKASTPLSGVKDKKVVTVNDDDSKASSRIGERASVRRLGSGRPAGEPHSMSRCSRW
jgi:hypothetical protein